MLRYSNNNEENLRQLQERLSSTQFRNIGFEVMGTRVLVRAQELHDFFETVLERIAREHD